MNYKNKVKLALLFLLLFSGFGFSQSVITLKWGLESTKYFIEIQAAENQNSAYHPESNPKDKLYRYFSVTSGYHDAILPFFQMHERLWERFEEQTPVTLRTKLNFAGFAKTNDQYYFGIVKSLAPQLYFDFIGEPKEYVLESIEVTTIKFEEYRGGGYSLNEAWYDIELKHVEGTYVYPVESKLKFTGSGRAVLRFWSDNYYPNVGMTPSGCYTIDIKFNFIVNGQKSSVKTGAFKIDV